MRTRRKGHGEDLFADWLAGCQLTREGAWEVLIPWAGKPDDAEHAAVRPGEYRGANHGGHPGQDGIEHKNPWYRPCSGLWGENQRVKQRRRHTGCLVKARWS